MKTSKFKYNTLLFDADDTLFDFQLAEKNALKEMLSDFSLPHSDEICNIYHEINDILWKDFEKGLLPPNQTPGKIRFQKLLNELGEERDSNKMNSSYTKHLGEQHMLIDGAVKVCSALCKTHRLFIITNGTPSVQHARLNACEIRTCFDGIFISQEIGLRKPDCEYFNYVFNKIRPVDMAKTLIIGDSLTSDILGGINSGVDTCWFNPHKKTAPPEITPTYQITALEQLFDIV